MRWCLLALVLLSGCAIDDPPEQFAFDLVRVTGLDHEMIEINPAEVVAIHAPRLHRRELPPSAHCAIKTTDGKFISVLETCQEVADRLEHSH